MKISIPSIEERKLKLERLRKIILRKEVLINKALMDDLGKSHFETYLTEVGFVIEEINFVVKNLESWAKPKKVSTPMNLFPASSYIHPSPYGEVLIMSPWNYPFQLCIAPMIGALAAGNRVVLKPSELAPNTAKVLREIIEEAYKPNEVRIVEGGVAETQELLKQKFDYIFFTGSTAVGKIVMKAAAEHLTPVTLELGGKSPCIIDETADIDLAAKRIAWGKFLNAGQTCVAPDYVLVPKKYQHEFLERLNFHLKNFYGDSPAGSPDFPRIINEKHFDRLEELLIPEKIAVGGEKSRVNKFISPTVMKDISWSDKIMEDEIFGPILPVLPYEDLNEALEEVAKRSRPLAFYVFSEDSKKAKAIMREMSFGGGCINDTLMHLANPNLPFGGIGGSGMGSYHGKKSFETFSHMKSVLIQKTKVDIPLRYPPYNGKLSWLKLFLR
ncbi:aldehyde dehydrogenase [Peredibacter starrii]|uniref:Aldehyde dehydrogenase n=1 Tax=Peredibacter starrii TaxID=28202 RepID=A0AAX4HSM6_9BACT|nr:aldehyde dehydrogenase [Peredibacter starrii]WPU66031.1 aldehyde dehydrogenase [Peredibacter starrii]